MIPKEKASELLERFHQAMYSTHDPAATTVEYCHRARQCALIAVDEIVEFMNMDDDYNKDCHMANTHWVPYWQQVKEEINKL